MSEEQITDQVLHLRGEVARKTHYTQIDFVTEERTVRLYVAPTSDGKVMLSIFAKDNFNEDGSPNRDVHFDDLIIPYDAVKFSRKQLTSLLQNVIQDIEDMERV